MTNQCANCKRPAMTATRNGHGQLRRKSIADHDLCHQCWRSARASSAHKRPKNRMDGVLDELLAGRPVPVRG
jgi:hypothetical protein